MKETQKQRGDNNIKMDFVEIWRGNVDCIQLARDGGVSGGVRFDVKRH